MNNDVARRLNVWVNQKNFEEFVKLYVDERLEVLRKSLETSNVLEDIFKIQGQIKEVKRLLTLAEEVKSEIKRQS